MIVDGIGDLLAADVDALVNPINCTGVMGKGLALAYRAACKRGEVQLGAMFVTESGTPRPRWLIGFPTKQAWRAIRSIAVPALGCGLGGLDWRAVRPAIERAVTTARAARSPRRSAPA